MSRILVTGIGGNVGYGILKNIRQHYSGVDITGTNSKRISPGNHLCDNVHEVPIASNPEYIPTIKKICATYGIELIIPSTDLEIYILALHRDELPTVATSSAETCRMFLDKYQTHTKLQAHDITFAESILPSLYNDHFTDCIVKPREGRGSRGIHINPVDINSFSDEYIVQPLLKGVEITTAFYITKQNELHGHITMSRELKSGYTQYCEVTHEYDKEIEVYLQKLIAHIPIACSCNVQSIITDQGIIPFEVNCRISGTNSIRSQFGFKDVCYTVDEYLFNKQPEKPQITTGSAMRILDDIIYPGITLKDIDNNKDNFYLNT